MSPDETPQIVKGIPAALIDVIADYHNVGSIVIDGVAAVVVPGEHGPVRFESPRMPSQRKPGDLS